MDDIEIRPAEPGDLRALQGLLTHLHDHPAWTDENAAAAERAYAAMLSDSGRRVLIAFARGEPAGTIDVLTVANLTRDASPWAIIENLIVVEKHRRRHIGQRLLEQAVAFAGERGCYKVQLVSANRRDAAHHLYEATGFDANVSGYRRYLRDVT